MQGNKKNRIIWFVGTVTALCVCHLLIRYVFFSFHGNYHYSLLLLLIGLVAVVIASFFDGRKLMICTVIGYIGGFAAGIAFGANGVDPGSGAISNWWIIWTVSFFISIIVGAVWENNSRRES